MFGSTADTNKPMVLVADLTALSVQLPAPEPHSHRSLHTPTASGHFLLRLFTQYMLGTTCLHQLLEDEDFYALVVWDMACATK